MYMQYILVIDKTSLNPSTFLLKCLCQAMKVSGHVYCLTHIHDRSLSLLDTHTWPLTFIAWHTYMRSCMCVKQWKWAFMYVCQAMKVSGHVCVSSNASERSCMCVKQWKWAVMYVCQGYRLFTLLWFLYWILELFSLCGIFCLFFVFVFVLF
jgi:hypothetical protein